MLTRRDLLHGSTLGVGSLALAYLGVTAVLTHKKDLLQLVRGSRDGREARDALSRAESMLASSPPRPQAPLLSRRRRFMTTAASTRSRSTS